MLICNQVATVFESEYCDEEGNQPGQHRTRKLLCDPPYEECVHQHGQHADEAHDIAAVKKQQIISCEHSHNDKHAMSYD